MVAAGQEADKQTTHGMATYDGRAPVQPDRTMGVGINRTFYKLYLVVWSVATGEWSVQTKTLSLIKKNLLQLSRHKHKLYIN